MNFVFLTRLALNMLLFARLSCVAADRAVVVTIQQTWVSPVTTVTVTPSHSLIFSSHFTFSAQFS